MMASVRTEQVTAPDGGQFDAWAFLPEGGEGGSVPGILLLQEVYGVGDFMRAKATALTELGYAVLCPDVFWRVERHVSLAHDDAGLAAAFDYMGRFAQIPPEVTTGDLAAALGALRGLPEVGGERAGGRGPAGKVAVLGYCLGGRLAYEVAAAADPDACVAYYGSGIATELDLVTRITCPTLYHFGGADQYIAREDVDRVAAAVAERPGVELVVQEEAGHAFENSFAPAFSNPDAAAKSWPVTVAFLAKTLGR